MAYGSKSQQNMDFKWQLARKIDRLDLGTFAALDFYYRNVIIHGLVRAIDPPEPEKPDDEKKNQDRPIREMMDSIDNRINAMQGFDTTALLMGKSNLPEVQDFQKKTVSCWYEIAEVIYRCKLTDSVKAAGEEI